MERRKCPECNHYMILIWFDGPAATTYRLWRCAVCGYECDFKEVTLR